MIYLFIYFKFIYVTLHYLFIIFHTLSTGQFLAPEGPIAGSAPEQKKKEKNPW